MGVCVRMYVHACVRARGGRRYVGVCVCGCKCAPAVKLYLSNPPSPHFVFLCFITACTSIGASGSVFFGKSFSM